MRAALLLTAALWPFAPLSAAAPPLELAAEATPDEEIIVTGERVARTLAETSSSVAVLTGEQLDRLGGAGDTDDILGLIPNLTPGGGESGPTIRGQDTTGVLVGPDAFLGGTRSRATLSVDGRPLSYNEFVYGLSPLWDVERVEVFRGPQTTTQGRNAIAGAIFVQTREPTPEFEGRARVQVGDFALRQGSLALSGPLAGDALTGRIAVDYRKSGDFVRRPNTADIGVSNDADDLSLVRGKLRFAPAGLPVVARLTVSHVETLSAQSDAIRGDLRRREDLGDNAAFFSTNVDSVTLAVDAQLGGGFDSSTTLTWANIDVRRNAPAGVGNGGIKVRERSLEQLIRYGDSASPLSALAGLYLFEQDQVDTIDLSAFLGISDFRDRQTSQGVFAEATWRPTTRLALTAGGRFQRDLQDREGALSIFALDYRERFEAFLPKASVAYELAPRLTVGAVAARGSNPGGATILFQTGEPDVFGSERLWSYEVFARWRSADGAFGLNGNAFVTDFEDTQRPVTSIIPGLADPQTVNSNADDARAYGLEIDGFARPAAWLNLRAGLGLLETELRRYSVAEDPAAVEGNAFERSPGLTLSAGVTIEPVAGLQLDAQARHSTSYFSDDANSADIKNAGYTIVDATAGYTWGNVRGFVFARNLLDEFYTTELYAADFGPGGEPRRVGAGVEVRF